MLWYDVHKVLQICSHLHLTQQAGNVHMIPTLKTNKQTIKKNPQLTIDKVGIKTYVIWFSFCAISTSNFLDNTKCRVWFFFYHDLEFILSHWINSWTECSAWGCSSGALGSLRVCSCLRFFFGFLPRGHLIGIHLWTLHTHRQHFFFFWGGILCISNSVWIGKFFFSQLVEKGFSTLDSILVVSGFYFSSDRLQSWSRHLFLTFLFCWSPSEF